jgi:chemotaxis family two-component system response regulator Rcp1
MNCSIRVVTYHPFRPIELLLVEDNEGDVRLTEEAFKDGDISVHLSVASDGVEALDFLHRSGRFSGAPRPDLILLDLNLPGKNGAEVLLEIENDPRYRSIPVVVMTTSTAGEDVQRCYNLNANCYITKPMSFDALVAVVKSIEDFWLGTVTLATA